MPEGGECALVVMPGGSEVWTSAIGGVQTPSCLGGGREQRSTGYMYTHRHTKITQKGNGTNVAMKNEQKCV